MINRFYVYVHRHADDGKIFYVGKGSRPDRMIEGKSRNSYWKNVVAKHGFMAEVVAAFETDYLSQQCEKELIAWYGKENLVNMTDGGDGHAGLPKTAETIEKLRAASSGENHANWGKKLSEETCRKKSEAMKNSPLSLRGKKLPDWWKQKIADTKTGEQNPMFGKTGAKHHNSRPVKDVKTGDVYESMTDAAKAIGMKVGTLYNMLKGTNPNRTSLEFA